MKRLLSVLALCIILSIPVFASAEVSWSTANQATIGWDAVAAPTVGEISYRVYLANAVTDPDKANPVVVGTTADLSLVVTLNTQGRYFVGVSSVLTIDGVETESVEINWSDTAEGNKDGLEFGLQYFIVSPPGGFGIR